MSKLLAVLPLLAALGSLARLSAGEVGFTEDFALAKDRAEALKGLIPGTEEHYFYSCLLAQEKGDLDAVEGILKAWIERHGRTPRVEEIENRQALLRYPQDPKRSLEFLRQRLGIDFNHQREILGEKPKLPSALDPALISREAYTARALERHRGNLDGFEDRAIETLASAKLDGTLRRVFLSRLRRPDIAGLPALVVEDLKFKDSGGFGSLPIHGLLLLDQLDECLKLRPGLLNEARFVAAYLAKLRPSADGNWQEDAGAREEYLERLWSFASRLNASHNSLKVHVLNHRLRHDRSLDKYDRERFLLYLTFPRAAGYMNPKYLEREEVRRGMADTAADFRAATTLEAVGDDEPLVRSFLAHFFVADEDYAAFAPYVNDVYLKELFAETKIVNGLGDMEKWYALLPPEKYRALQERIDIDFDPANKTLFGSEEPVALDLHLKNVKNLIVKVFEINGLNWYRANPQGIDASIDLDGLVANEETAHAFSEPPLRRVKRRFEFPSLRKPGTYVLEFIGNGRSSRAIVRKGTLRYLVRTGAAGQVFTILDGDKKVSDARIWLEGREYSPDKDGLIAIPFSTKPGRQPIVLVRGDLAVPEAFDHEAESYALQAGIHVDREALLPRAKATVLVRPLLTVNGARVSLSLLEESTLVITSTDGQGVKTSKEVKGFALAEERESAYEFQVPPDLRSIEFVLKGRVQNLSQGKKVDLEDRASFPLNGIDATEKVEDILFSRSGPEHSLDVLGKNGEPKAGRPVRLQLKHRDFKDVAEATLATDARGRIALGPLAGIEWTRAEGPQGTAHIWLAARDACTYPPVLQGRAGSELRVPALSGAEKPLRSELSLLETRGGTFVRDRFDALSIEGGYIVIRDLPAGDYSLYLKEPGQAIAIRLAEGKESEGYVSSGRRQLEVSDARPLQIASIRTAGESLEVQVAGAGAQTRVHIFAGRYASEHSPFADLFVPGRPSPQMAVLSRPRTTYVEGRDIGDEYRYVLERKYAKKYPGNLLARPGLLLNPWALRSTETGTQEAQAGTDLTGGGAGGAAGRFGGKRESRARGGGGAADGRGFTSLDFLGRPAAVLANLRPDSLGLVTVKLADLGPHHQIGVVAVDAEETVHRQVSLPEAAMPFRDLRLKDGLDPAKHFAEEKKVVPSAAETPFSVADIATSDLEVYDTLAGIHGLFLTLTGDATLAEFGFAVRWPELKPEEKREKYSKYACHELNFFLYKKDPKFFEEVVKPYLANKLDKTFLDRWLLGEKLDEFLRPWSYERLNAFEKILLARRIEGEGAGTSRHLQDILDLIPPDLERWDHLFATALKGKALETADALGLEKAKENVKLARELKEQRLGEPEGAAKDAAAEVAEAARPAAPLAPPAPAAAATPAASRARGGVAKAAKAGALRAEVTAEAEEEAVLADAKGAADLEGLRQDLARRKEVRQLFRKLEKTQEWVENNYYKLPIEAQEAGLITVNRFWMDYAGHDERKPFLSKNVAEASRNFTEMMLALAVLDLPFTAGQHATEAAGSKFTLRPASPLLIYAKTIGEAAAAAEKAPLLVTQNLYRHGDRYRQEGSEKLDKFVTGEFLSGAVYGCQVVITNPASSAQKIDVLLQIPARALPVLQGQATRSVRVNLEPYRTWTADYFFYFPAPGLYGHFPVHASKDGKLLAFAAPMPLKVVEKLSAVDTTSWEHISQDGTPEGVLEFLASRNLGNIQLNRIAWRMKDRGFFEKAISVLVRRHAYESTLWSYGILHDVPGAIEQYLRHRDDFVGRCGRTIESRLLTIDPVERKAYQHREYYPLVNARAHRLGKARTILNNRFAEQYAALLDILCYRPALDDDDRMSITYYLLLQDRIDEAVEFFGKVDPIRLATRLQHDYFRSYLAFSTGEPGRAREVASRYAAYSVDRWRDLFANVLAQLDEIEGKGPAVIDKEDRGQAQAQLASTEPNFDLEIEGRKVTVRYQNLEEIRVSYYPMDIELLFSRSPFLGEYSSRFAAIRPNAEEKVALGPKSGTSSFQVPDRFSSGNVLVEVTGAGIKKSKTYFSNAMAVAVVENYAQARVTGTGTGKPLAGVYVKVYARTKGGTVRFFKDGYTDLRGRFDYGSLSTNEIDDVERFAILFLSESSGALVREASPPKQ
jgi:hypothetical protein